MHEFVSLLLVDSFLYANVCDLDHGFAAEVQICLNDGFIRDEIRDLLSWAHCGQFLYDAVYYGLVSG